MNWRRLSSKPGGRLSVLAHSAQQNGALQSAQVEFVSIVDGAAELGSYERNYPSFGEETFEPFRD
jgi:hypothetical protein